MRQDLEGTITIELDAYEATMVVNYLNRLQATLAEDLNSMFQIEQAILRQAMLKTADEHHATLDRLTQVVKKKWPTLVAHQITIEEKPTLVAPDPEVRPCDEYGHCACDVGDKCCWCGEVLTATSMRRESAVRVPRFTDDTGPKNPFVH